MNVQLNKIGNVGLSPNKVTPNAPSKGPSFADTLNSIEKNKASSLSSFEGAKEPLMFSSHAVERMRLRGVNFTPVMMDKINKAVDMAAQKGAKDTLVLTDESALIVNVKNNKVVTVMDKNQLKENVFTNIDSTVVV